MQVIVNEIISTLIQIILFASVPFLVYLFRYRKNSSFFRYIGLFKPSKKSIHYSVAVTVLILSSGLGLAFFDEEIKQVMFDPHTPSGMLRQMGLSLTSLIVLFLIAVFKTSFAEELFFRGFLAKHLIAMLGFKLGNLFQAVFFGLVHLLLISVLIQSSFSILLIIFLFSTSAGWLLGYIKIKLAGGSIIPGWIAHSLGNALSYFLIAFLI